MRRRVDVRDDRGSAAVEFALVGPLFVYLLIGLTVYGGWFWLAQGMQGLAAEGARAAVAGLTADERAKLAKDAVTSGGGPPAVSPEDLRVSVETTDIQVRVSVSYAAANHPLMALAGLVPAPPSVITRSATVRMGGY